MTDLTTTSLTELIGRRRRCLEQLLEIGRRQADLIAVGNMTDLMRLLAAKQQLILALQTIERDLAPYHDEDPDARTWSSDDARARCASDAERCRQLIHEVMTLEQSGERQLVLRRDEAAGQLRNVHSGIKIRAAYMEQR